MAARHAEYMGYTMKSKAIFLVGGWFTTVAAKENYLTRLKNYLFCWKHGIHDLVTIYPNATDSNVFYAFKRPQDQMQGCVNSECDHYFAPLAEGFRPKLDADMESLIRITKIPFSEEEDCNQPVTEQLVRHLSTNIFGELKSNQSRTAKSGAGKLSDSTTYNFDRRWFAFRVSVDGHATYKFRYRRMVRGSHPTLIVGLAKSRSAPLDGICPDGSCILQDVTRSKAVVQLYRGPFRGLLSSGVRRRASQPFRLDLGMKGNFQQRKVDAFIIDSYNWQDTDLNDREKVQLFENTEAAGWKTVVEALLNPASSFFDDRGCTIGWCTQKLRIRDFKEELPRVNDGHTTIPSGRCYGVQDGRYHWG